MADRAALLLLVRVTLVRSPVVALARVYFSRCRLQAILPRPNPSISGLTAPGLLPVALGEPGLIKVWENGLDRRDHLQPASLSAIS